MIVSQIKYINESTIYLHVDSEERAQTERSAWSRTSESAPRRSGISAAHGTGIRGDSDHLSSIQLYLECCSKQTIKQST